MTNALVRTEVQSSSLLCKKCWVWTSPVSEDVSAHMEDADAPDPDLMDLVVLLCTRIGMIMEDMSPLAIDASSDVLKGRVWTAVPYSFPYSPKSQFGE
ncbi:hypothetical protein [Sphingomonas sp.]|uniref:hypothetical protein n=1 Tax=Sphingomonas sp. TaxID=28214 RepID=UPI00286C16CA|nr:hypothetical protein [Sphingomonas sp.]